MLHNARLAGLLIALLAVACTSGAITPDAPPATASPTAPVATTPAVSPTPTPTPTPEPRTVLADTRVTRLVIPSVGIDADVVGSRAIPNTSQPPPGCPPIPPGQETLTVPNHGIATPEQAFEGLEHKSWIFGHSRWQNEPGLFFVLQDMRVGDELFVDGFDRQTGEEVRDQRFVVEGLYLTDKQSGGRLVTAASPAEIPTLPTVILQTSARASGANAQWLLDRAQLLARANNLVEGDIEDPCKYLLLFVIARSASS